MRYKQLVKRLRKLGCEEVRRGKGSHVYWRNPTGEKMISIPDWGSKDLPPGTVRGIINKLGLSRKDFGPVK